MFQKIRSMKSELFKMSSRENTQSKLKRKKIATKLCGVIWLRRRFNYFDDKTARCVNVEEMCGGDVAWKCVLDDFRSNEAPMVVSFASPLARLKMSDGDCIQIFFIRAQKLYSRLQQSRKHFNLAIFNTLILNGLPEQYGLFYVLESFDPSGNYADLRKRFLNHSIGEEQRLEQSESHYALPSKFFSGLTPNNQSRKGGRSCYLLFLRIYKSLNKRL